MNPRAIGLSVAGLLVAGGVIAGASGAQAEPAAPVVDLRLPMHLGDEWAGGINCLEFLHFGLRVDGR